MKRETNIAFASVTIIIHMRYFLGLMTACWFRKQ